MRGFFSDLGTGAVSSIKISLSGVYWQPSELRLANVTPCAATLACLGQWIEDNDLWRSPHLTLLADLDVSLTARASCEAPEPMSFRMQAGPTEVANPILSFRRMGC